MPIETNDIETENLSTHTELEVDSVEDIGYFDENKNLTFLHVNIRRLNTNFEQLITLIERFRRKPDIIVCSETGNLVNYNIYQIENYEIF